MESYRLRSTLFYVCLTAWVGCAGLEGESAAPIPSLLLEPAELFEEVADLELDDSVLVAELSHVDVSREGDILVVDDVSKAAMLFDAAGRFRVVLEGAACDPGANWRPEHGTFLSDGSVVIATPYQVFLFDKEGTCLRLIEEFEGVPRALCSPAAGTLAGFVAVPGRFQVQVVDLQTGAGQIYEIPAPRLPKFTFLYKIPTGLDCEPEQDIWWLYPESAQASPLASMPLGTIPHFYRPLRSEDVSPESQKGVMEDVISITGSGTMAVAVLAANRGVHMVVHSGIPASGETTARSALGLTVVSLAADGIPVARTVRWPRTTFPKAARDGDVYFAVPPTDSLGSTGNPRLKVLRLVP